eukprot:37747-Amphidinium_carterae.1
MALSCLSIVKGFLFTQSITTMLFATIAERGSQFESQPTLVRFGLPTHALENVDFSLGDFGAFL